MLIIQKGLISLNLITDCSLSLSLVSLSIDTQQARKWTPKQKSKNK